MAEGHEFAFLTLTHRGRLSPAASRARWSDCWPKLSARMRRACDHKPQYLFVHEQHKSGKLHTHFITSDRLGKRWWKDNPAETGFGYMNDWSPVVDRLAAGSYVSKYLAKMLAELKWPGGFRRVGTSRGWPKLPEMDEKVGWDWIVAKRAWEVRAELESVYLQGFAVTVIDNNGFVQELMADSSVILQYR